MAWKVTFKFCYFAVSSLFLLPFSSGNLYFVHLVARNREKTFCFKRQAMTLLQKWVQFPNNQKRRMWKECVISDLCPVRAAGTPTPLSSPRLFYTQPPDWLRMKNEGRWRLLEPRVQFCLLWTLFRFLTEINIKLA